MVEKSCNVCTDFQSLRVQNRKIMKEEFPCPPDAGTLGRSTWTFLHTMAAYYPETPSTAEQVSMNGFIDSLSKFYPCSHCAEHLQGEIVSHPPKLKSNIELSQWFCEVHNEVNSRLDKPKFDCSRVMEFWRYGSKGSDCFSHD